MSEIRQSTMSLSSMSSDTAAWIGWPLKYQPMRVALAHLLMDENLQNVRCSADQLITPLNSIAGAGTNDAVMMVTEQLIKNAFSISGDDLFFSYESLGINGANDMCWIQCRFKRSGSSRNNAKRERHVDFCSFKDVNERDRMEEMEQGNDQREQSTLNNSSLFRRQSNMPDDVCQNFRDMLIDLQADKDRRGIKKARDQKGK